MPFAGRALFCHFNRNLAFGISHRAEATVGAGDGVGGLGREVFLDLTFPLSTPLYVALGS